VNLPRRRWRQVRAALDGRVVIGDDGIQIGVGNRRRA
jgi:hypothetical protein